MLNAPDITRLPYTPDLTESGIACALRSLAFDHDQASGSLYSRLRRMVGSVAVELAFRRHLNGLQVPYQVRGLTPFSDADRYDVSLGGHRCEVKTFITSRRSQITAMRKDPGLVLRAPALIPQDEFDAVNHQDSDLYLFAFLLGLTTNSPEDIRKAIEAGQNTCLVHPLHAHWARPEAWAPLGRLVLKSEGPDPLEIEIGGLDAERNPISEKLRLEPLTRIPAANAYYSLTYVRAPGLPSARLGLRCERLGEAYLIHPHEWGNIWVYGLETWLAGFMTHEEFRRRSSTIFAGSRVFQYSKTQTRNLSVPVADLRPLETLLERVRDWEAGRATR